MTAPAKGLRSGHWQSRTGECANRHGAEQFEQWRPSGNCSSESHFKIILALRILRLPGTSPRQTFGVPLGSKRRCSFYMDGLHAVTLRPALHVTDVQLQ